MNFLDTYMRYVAPVKGSELFHKWSCIAILSAAIERKVWRQWHTERIYPNMYIVLSGKPGVGKTFSSRRAMDFVNKLNNKYKDKGIKTPTDKLTPASLIKQFKRAAKPLGKEQFHSLFSHADELSSFILDIGGGSIASDITKFFDCPDLFRKELARDTDELTVISNLSFSFLWDTTPTFLQRYLPKEISGEGLLSRIIFVTDLEGQPHDLIPPDPDWALKARLDDYYERIFQLRGEVKNSPEALEFLNSWYKNVYVPAHGQLAGAGPFISYHARKPLHVIKLSMLMALSRLSLVVSKQDTERALELLNELEPSMIEAFGLTDITGESDFAQVVMSFIGPHEVTEKELRRRLTKSSLFFAQGPRWDGLVSALKVDERFRVHSNGSGTLCFMRVK